jgi:hypothetical protein
MFTRLCGDSLRTMNAICRLKEGLEDSMLVVLDVLGISEEDARSTGPPGVHGLEVPVGDGVCPPKLSANLAELEEVSMKREMIDQVGAELCNDRLTCRGSR